ncbi:MAG: hypothetical protein R3E66_02145 [bacterium]
MRTILSLAFILGVTACSESEQTVGPPQTTPVENDLQVEQVDRSNWPSPAVSSEGNCVSELLEPISLCDWSQVNDGIVLATIESVELLSAPFFDGYGTKLETCQKKVIPALHLTLTAVETISGETVSELWIYEKGIFNSRVYANEDGLVEWSNPEIGFYPGQRLVFPFSYASNGLAFTNLFAHYQVSADGLLRRPGVVDVCNDRSPDFKDLEALRAPIEGCAPLSDEWQGWPEFLSSSSPSCSNGDPEGYCVVALDCDLDLETCINNRCTPK